MKATPELKKRLESAGKRYHKHRTKVPIRWRTGKTAAASPHGFIFMNPELFTEAGYDIDQVDEYRLLRMVMAHEVGHFNHSELTGKRDFGDSYDGLERVAGKVWNIMEDAYVDEQVKRDYPGLRPVYAYHTVLMMDSDEFRAPIDEYVSGVEARIEGLVQLMAAGWVKGFEDADDDVRLFLARQRPRMEAVRVEDDTDEREALMWAVMDDLEDEIPDSERADADAFADGLGGILGALVRKSINGEREGDERKASNPENTDEDPDIDDELDALDGLDGLSTLGAAGRAGGVPNTDRIEEASSSEEHNYDRLMKALSDERAGIEQRKSNRGLRQVAPRGEGYQDIEQLGAETGIIDEVVRRFEEFAEENDPELSETGPILDIDQAVAHASGDVGIREFHREAEPNETGDRCVNVTLDCSGSMSNRPMMNAKLAILALATACEAIGDDFTANTYSTGHGAGDTPDSRYDLRLVCAPRETFDPKWLDTFTAGNLDPTCAGVEDALEITAKSGKSERVMFVITDGKATIGAGERGSAKSMGPVEDARKAVNKARNKGVEVTGIGMGGISHDDLTETFGSEGYIVTDRETLADDLVEEYRKTLKTEQNREVR